MVVVGGRLEKAEEWGRLRGEGKQEAELIVGLRAAELPVSGPGRGGRGSLRRAGWGAHSFWGRQVGQVAKQGQPGWWGWVNGLGSHSGTTG